MRWKKRSTGIEFNRSAIVVVVKKVVEDKALCLPHGKELKVGESVSLHLSALSRLSYFQVTQRRLIILCKIIYSAEPTETGIRRYLIGGI